MSIIDWFLFILTFVTGVFLGMFLYVSSFKPIYIPENLGGNEDEAAEFSVIGKEYGGKHAAGYIAPSFRILEDGSFDYLPGGEGGDALDPMSGHIPRKLMQDLKAAVDIDDLEEFSRLVSRTDCRSHLDGNDYKYQIIIAADAYAIDTCKTDVLYSDDLIVILNQIWDYMANPVNGVLADKPAVDATLRFMQKYFSPLEFEVRN